MGIAALFLIYWFVLAGVLLLATGFTGVEAIGLALILALVGVALWLLWRQHYKEDEDAHPHHKPNLGPTDERQHADRR